MRPQGASEAEVESAEDTESRLADLRRRRAEMIDVIAEGLLELLLRERAALRPNNLEIETNA